MPTFKAQSPIIPNRSPFRVRDSQLAKMQQPSNNDRLSLAIEVNNMWNMKPIEMHHQQQQQQQQQHQQHYNINMFSSSHLLTQLLVSQAILDSNEFKIQSFDNLDKLKKELAEIQERIHNMSKSVELETRIIKISKSLENKNFKNSRHSVIYLQNQRQNNEHKMKHMVEQLNYLKQREIDIKKTLLQHNAAVLNKGIHTLESQKVSHDATHHHHLEADMNQIVKKIDSISIDVIPNHTNLTIPQKLSYIDDFLTNQQLEGQQLTNQQLTNQQQNDDSYDKHKAKQLFLTQLEKNDLLSKLLDMESSTDKLLETITLYPKRQAALKLELAQYKSESSELKLWVKERQGEQEADDGANETHAKYKKLLQEQSSYHQDRLQEQSKSIQQHKNAHDSLQGNYQHLMEEKSSLDLLIKEKSRHLDNKDNNISRLNHELRSKQRPGFNQPSQDATEREKQRLKQLFDAREAHWTEHTTMMEDSFDEIMDNFDKLTTQAIEFESHRMKYDRRIEELNKTIQQLEMELIEEKVKKIGHNDTGEVPTSTAALRKEFRILVADIKRAHQQRMDQEADEIKRLQAQLNELHGSNNNFKYQHTMSTQTD